MSQSAAFSAPSANTRRSRARCVSESCSNAPSKISSCVPGTDPVLTLARIRDWLAPGGLLALETPNLDSWDARLFCARWWGGYHFPRHWVLFDPQSIRVALDAQAHQDLPFGLLVEELRPERNLAHTPIFQVAYTYQDARRTSFDLPRLRMTPLGVETGTTQFDLILNVEDAAEGLTMALEYNTDLFEGATIQRLLAGMEELLGAVAARPDTSLGDLRELAADAEARWRASARRELETLRQESIKTVRRKALTPAAVPRQEDRRP